MNVIHQVVEVPFQFCDKCPHLEMTAKSCAFNGIDEIESIKYACYHENLCWWVRDHLRKDEGENG